MSLSECQPVPPKKLKILCLSTSEGPGSKGAKRKERGDMCVCVCVRVCVWGGANVQTCFRPLRLAHHLFSSSALETGHSHLLDTQLYISVHHLAICSYQFNWILILPLILLSN